MTQEKKKPWIFNTIEGLRDLSPIEVKQTYDWVIQHIILHLNIKAIDVKPVGSFGKKTHNQISSDIDIGLSIDSLLKNNPSWTKDNLLDNVDKTLINVGVNTKKIDGFNQISMALPIRSPYRSGLGQVDFMLSPNLEWSNFIYHSPDFTKKESKYKGVVRTILLMAILSESTRHILHKDLDGNTIEVESKIIRLPDGIYSTRRSFMGKKGLIKKAKLLKEYDKLITRNPKLATQLILGPKYMPKDCNSFESIWKIINKPDFIHKKHLNLILSKFKKGLEINNLDIPEEFNKI